MSNILSNSQVIKLLDFTSDLATEAATLARRNYVVERKAGDSSPVTELDRFLNQKIVEYLAKEFPEHRIVAEESDNLPTDDKKTPVWFVDPLDGTEQFIRGIDEWAIQIGLVVNNVVQFGVVAPPLREDMYFASRKQGAFRRNRNTKIDTRLKCRAIENLKAVKVVESRFHASKRVRLLADELEVKEFIPMGGLGIKLAHIADGFADIYFHLSPRCSLWDICAPQVILEEAGGLIVTLNDLPVDYYQPSPFKVGIGYLAIGSVKIRDQIMPIVREHWRQHHKS